MTNLLKNSLFMVLGITMSHCGNENLGVKSIQRRANANNNNSFAKTNHNTIADNDAATANTNANTNTNDENSDQNETSSIPSTTDHTDDAITSEKPILSYSADNVKLTWGSFSEGKYQLVVKIKGSNDFVFCRSLGSEPGTSKAPCPFLEDLYKFDEKTDSGLCASVDAMKTSAFTFTGDCPLIDGTVSFDDITQFGIASTGRYEDLEKAPEVNGWANFDRSIDYSKTPLALPYNKRISGGLDLSIAIRISNNEGGYNYHTSVLNVASRGAFWGRIFNATKKMKICYDLTGDNLNPCGAWYDEITANYSDTMDNFTNIDAPSEKSKWTYNESDTMFDMPFSAGSYRVNAYDQSSPGDGKTWNMYRAIGIFVISFNDDGTYRDQSKWHRRVKSDTQ